MLNQFVIVSLTGQWQEAVQTEAITRTITHPPGLRLVSHGVDLLLEPEWRNIHFCSKVNSLLSRPDSLLRFSDFSRVLLIWKMAGQGQSGWWQRVSERMAHFSPQEVWVAQRLKLACHLSTETNGRRQKQDKRPDSNLSEMPTKADPYIG